MNKQQLEDLMSVSSLSLAIVACGILIYFSRDPSITGYVTMQSSSFNVFWVVLLVVLGVISLFMGLAFGISKLTNEVETHKRAIVVNSKSHDSLAEYISKARKNGFEDEEITQKLVNLGWDNKDIKKYLNNELN